MSKRKDREEMAEQTIAFGFEKPSRRTFKACQFIDMTLLDPLEADSEENGRGFSIASSPCEETPMVVTPMCDTAFKRVLNRMPFGTAIKIKHVEKAAAK
jgi:ferredoxin-NADP reductase